MDNFLKALAPFTKDIVQMPFGILALLAFAVALGFLFVPMPFDPPRGVLATYCLGVGLQMIVDGRKEYFRMEISKSVAEEKTDEEKFLFQGWGDAYITTTNQIQKLCLGAFVLSIMQVFLT